MKSALGSGAGRNFCRLRVKISRQSSPPTTDGLQSKAVDRGNSEHVATNASGAVARNQEPSPSESEAEEARRWMRDDPQLIQAPRCSLARSHGSAPIIVTSSQLISGSPALVPSRANQPCRARGDSRRRSPGYCAARQSWRADWPSAPARRRASLTLGRSLRLKLMIVVAPMTAAAANT
jgi:hypothetical protein